MKKNIFKLTLLTVVAGTFFSVLTTSKAAYSLTENNTPVKRFNGNQWIDYSGKVHCDLGAWPKNAICRN